MVEVKYGRMMLKVTPSEKSFIEGVSKLLTRHGYLEDSQSEKLVKEAWAETQRVLTKLMCHIALRPENEEELKKYPRFLTDLAAKVVEEAKEVQ